MTLLRVSLVTILARRRVPIGFASALAVLWLAQPTAVTLLSGGAIALAGEGLRLWAAGHLNKSREVTSSGPYRWLAHPLYVGSSVMGAGLAVASNSGLVALLVAVYLGTTIAAAIRSEEAFLRRTFGEGYDRYRRGDDRSANRPDAADRRFTVARAMANREYRAVAGLAVAVLLLLIKAAYNGMFWRAAGISPIKPGG
jgi:protein-S-isoprenylcysteine O-methyltransferase Ste14